MASTLRGHVTQDLHRDLGALWSLTRGLSWTELAVGISEGRQRSTCPKLVCER